MSTGTHDPAPTGAATQNAARPTGRTGPLQLIADIGGTHARFALCTGVNDIHAVQVMESRAHPTLEAAIRQYLSDAGNPSVQRAAIGIANPVLDDHVKMTNGPWAFSIEQMRMALGLAQLHVLNDFAALAMALPYLPADELEQVGGGPGARGAPLGLLGPGTGLGVSALIPMPRGNWLPLATEGGHARFAPADDTEEMIWRHAVERFGGHVSQERLISGSGLRFIYECLCEDHGAVRQPYTPSQISEHAIAGGAPICRQALDTFCAMLGSAASDLAVTLGARGGVYIGGGIIKKLGSYFAASPFRARFEDKGRFRHYVAAIPVYVIRSQQPALTGAAAWLGQHSS
ncbi:glucokinase [Pusillimonas sp. TS35]|uniref:glucokinase n=1 Tax=Paracandidimonas lactea TaxID=2895524 RepID=UPI001372295E|nr:glucokinase [Paracandidimonas lactea]MYN13418.1 glucokinase [Pusillimonas sp. TS35]